MRERTVIAEREIAARKRREVEVFARELRRRGEEAERKAAEAIREAVEKLERAQRAAAAAPRLRGEAVRAIRAAQDQVLQDPALELPPEVEAPEVPLAVGARVKARSLGITGELLALHGDGGAEVAVLGKRLMVPRTELVPVQGSGRRAERVEPFAAVSVKQKGAVPAEVNLVGLTVEEALPRVDKLLDDAAISDRREVRVIHGFGEGKLRNAVAGLLRGHPHVASWRAGGAGEGGGGVTIVELKE